MTLRHLGHLILLYGFLNNQAGRTEFGDGGDPSETQKATKPKPKRHSVQASFSLPKHALGPGRLHFASVLSVLRGSPLTSHRREVGCSFRSNTPKRKPDGKLGPPRRAVPMPVSRTAPTRPCGSRTCSWHRQGRGGSRCARSHPPASRLSDPQAAFPL